MCTACEQTNQVLIGEPSDLMLQARLNASIFRQEETLSKQLLLLLLFLFQLVHLLQKLAILLIVKIFLLLHLARQKPGGRRDSIQFHTAMNGLA